MAHSTAGSTIELPVGDVGEGRLAAAARRKCGRGSRAQHAARPARSAHSCADGHKDRPEHGGVDHLAAGGDAAEARLPAAARRRPPGWGRAAGDGARKGQRQPEHVDAPRKRRASFSAANASSSSSWLRAERRTRGASTAPSRPSDESQLRLRLSRAGLHRNVHREPRPAAYACMHADCSRALRVRRLAANSARLVARGRAESTGSRRPKLSITGKEARRGEQELQCGSWRRGAHGTSQRGSLERAARARPCRQCGRGSRARHAASRLRALAAEALLLLLQPAFSALFLKCSQP